MTRAALSILIVDDDPDDRRDIRRMLLCGSDQRYQFTEAQLGANCLRLLLGPTARRFDCVLLDYHLPDLDAMEVLVALGGTRAGTPAPVVVLTGADRHATSRLLQSGAMDFLGKGALTAEGLTRAVSNAVERFAVSAEFHRARIKLALHQEQLKIGAQIAGLALAEVNYEADSIDLSTEMAQLFWLADAATTIPRRVMHNRFHPHDQEKLAGAIEAALDPLGSGWFAMDHRILGPDQQQRWIRVRKQVRFSEGDLVRRPCRATLAALDITTEKNAEDALRRSEERFRGTFDNAAIGMAHVGLDGRWLRANVVMCRMTGYSQDELMAMCVENIMHPQDAEADREQRERILAGETETYSLDARHLRKDGVTVWARLTVALLCDPAGQPLHFICVLEDITQRRQMDMQLAAATEVAVNASRAKSEFLSSMSHELRTPLNAILGFAQLLDQGNPSLSVAQARGVQHILKGGWHLLDLVNQILDLALIDAGKLSLAMAPTALAPLLVDCQSMSENQAREKGIRLEFSAEPLQANIHADRKRLLQVLLNLLSNAIKYNRPGGSVTVNCTRQPHGRMRIAVADTGFGLATSQLEQLFEPFNRLGQERQATTGTGIGLVVARRLVEQMEGTIGVESEVGKGSIFWIEFDVLRDVPSALRRGGGAAPVLARSTPEGAVYKVLCVEDNEANLMLVQDIVARHPGLELLTARDGKAGIDVAREQVPDVILMDISLPDISGLQVLKLLALDAVTAHIPVIALSANAMPQDIAAGLESGFFDYLTKPIRIEALLHTLEEALDRPRAVSTPHGNNR